MIQGFIGLNDKYIEGIFVSDEMQSCGIGVYDLLNCPNPDLLDCPPID